MSSSWWAAFCIGRVAREHRLVDQLPDASRTFGGPADFIANFILQQASNFPKPAALLGGLYLLSHGIIKLVLVVAVLRQRLWAYPWMIGFLIAFIVYQTYRMALSPSVWLALLTAFDILVVVLTWIEYKRHRAANVH